MSSGTPARKRTVAVVILALVAVLAGVAAVYDTIRYLSPSSFQDQLGELEFMGSVNWLGALLSAVVAVIWFSVAYQLWTLNPQGWLFVAVIAVFNLIVLLMALFGSSTFAALMPGIVVSGTALILTVLPSTKAAFGISKV